MLRNVTAATAFVKIDLEANATYGSNPIKRWYTPNAYLQYLFCRSSKTAAMTHKSMWWWAGTCSVVCYNQSSYHKWEISGTNRLITQQTLQSNAAQSSQLTAIKRSSFSHWMALHTTTKAMVLFHLILTIANKMFANYRYCMRTKSAYPLLSISVLKSVCVLRT